MGPGLDLKKLAAKLGDHSVFAPSSSAMWTACAGSLIPNVLSEDTAGEAAAEGTVAHGVAETWLKSGKKPKHLLGTIERVEGFDIEITHSMLDFVEQYVTWCWQLAGDHYIESKVYFDDLTPIPRQGGTADHCACLPEWLIITDLKFGKGEQVYALNNTQLLIYAYAFFREYDWFYNFQRITIRICQPRLGHFDVIEITRDELLDFAAWVKERAYAAWVPNAPRSPGPKQCLWCKVKSECAARMLLEEQLCDDAFADLIEVTDADMADLKLRLDDDLDEYELRRPPAATLTVAQKVKLLAFRKMSEKWWNSLYDDLYSTLVRGENVPGMKLVGGKSFREYTNDESAAEHLEFLGLESEDIYKREIISPAQVEEKLRKLKYRRKDLPDLMKEVVRRTPGKPTMTTADDPRPSLDQGIDDVFDADDGEL